MDADASANLDTTAVWQRIAAWWAAQIGEGNEFQLKLIMPATDRMLDLRPGERVLDIACGNGNYARRMGRAGGRVVAFDGAVAFIDIARSRTTAADGDIQYHVADATDEAAMAALGTSSFDAAVCSMAMMDFATLDPLLRAVRALLRPAGRFVFSVSHPCFNSTFNRLTAELVSDDGRLDQVYGVHITRYLQPAMELTSGIINQPEPHPNFHRPLSVLLGSCFAAGFVLDGLEEPAFPPGSPAKNAFAWAKRPNIPPALVARLRPGGYRSV